MNTKTWHHSSYIWGFFYLKHFCNSRLKCGKYLIDSGFQLHKRRLQSQHDRPAYPLHCWYCWNQQNSELANDRSNQEGRPQSGHKCVGTKYWPILQQIRCTRIGQISKSRWTAKTGWSSEIRKVWALSQFSLKISHHTMCLYKVKYQKRPTQVDHILRESFFRKVSNVFRSRADQTVTYERAYESGVISFPFAEYTQSSKRLDSRDIHRCTSVPCLNYNITTCLHPEKHHYQNRYKNFLKLPG